MKMNLNTPKPRNPFVAPGLLRLAGAHRRSPGALRRQAQRELRREIDRLRPRP